MAELKRYVLYEISTQWLCRQTSWVVEGNGVKRCGTVNLTALFPFLAMACVGRTFSIVPLFLADVVAIITCVHAPCLSLV